MPIYLDLCIKVIIQEDLIFFIIITLFTVSYMLIPQTDQCYEVSNLMAFNQAYQLQLEARGSVL